MKQRITITLRKDLLDRVDEAIDGAQIRNRSHAIEYLLSTCVPARIKKAFVLAGGQGVKMRPFTYELPKPMLPVAGRPILEHIIDLLRDNGIRDIVILIGPLGEKIRNHFGDGTKFGVKIDYAEQKKRVGTAGPLKLAQEQLENGPFVMIYGDVLAEINLRDMIAFHEQCGAPVTMAVTSIDTPGDWGVVGLQGAKIVSYSEKPHRAALSHNINAGVFVIQPETIERVPSKGYSMLEQDVFPKLVKEGNLCGYVFDGKWFDVSTPKIYEQALKEWKK